jgi:hypothetical protein
MDDEKFWAIIEECHAASEGDAARKDQLIKAAMSRLSGEDALAFYQIFLRMMDAAFTWGLWGAAHVLNGGCGDDSFSDFRASLISRGRVVFEETVADPDSMADDDDIDIKSWFHEGFEYAIADGVKANIGRRPSRGGPLPRSPTGQRWLEATVRESYPKLAQKLASH